MQCGVHVVSTEEEQKYKRDVPFPPEVIKR